MRSNDSDRSLKNAFGNRSFNVGESHFPAGVEEGETFVIEAEQMQDRGMPVVDVHSLGDSFVAMVISRAVTEATFHTPASHPHREAFVVVIASVARIGVGGTAKLASPLRFRSPRSDYGYASVTLQTLEISGIVEAG